MKRGLDIAVRARGIYVVHHNLPGKKADFHAHDEHILFLPIRGEIRLGTRDKELACGPGRMIFLPGGTEHAFTSSDQQGERLIAMFEPKAWKKAGGPVPEACVLTASQLAKELLFYVLLLDAKARDEAAFCAHLLRVLGDTLTQASEAGAVESDSVAARARDPRVQKALDLIADNPEEEWDMNRLARRAGLSVRSLNRFFLRELGATPKQVLTRQRIERAREKLQGGASVTEAAFDSGYQSLSQFIRAFRGVTGKLPSEFTRR